MAAKLTQSLKDQVTCPICLEQFKDPRTLPCLHTYCRECLEMILKKGITGKHSIQCPECRESVQVEDVGSLKVNIWVNKSLSLLDLSNIETEEKSDKDMSYCEKHKDEQLKLFCTGCEKLICRDCTIIDHKGHKYYFAADVIDEHKEKLKIEVTKVTSIRTEIESRLKMLQESHEMTKTNQTLIEKAIDDTINKQIQIHNQAFEGKRAKLKEELTFITTSNQSNISAQQDGLQEHLKGLLSSIELTENLLTNGSIKDVLAISKDVRSGLAKQSSNPELLKIKKEELKPICMPELHVTRQLISNGIDKFATVSDPDPDKCVVEWSIAMSLDSIDVYIKNCQGLLLNITKNRITIHFAENDRRSLLLEGSMCDRPLEDGFWTLLDERMHQTIPHRCASIKDHDMKICKYEVNFKVDGHIIKGNPIKLCFCSMKQRDSSKPNFYNNINKCS